MTIVVLRILALSIVGIKFIPFWLSNNGPVSQAYLKLKDFAFFIIFLCY